MIAPPKRFENRPVRHKLHDFSTGAATADFLAAIGTGLSIVPVYMTWHSSAAGSWTLQKGSTGSVYFHGAFLANHEYQQTPWWDDGDSEGIGANTDLSIVKAAGVGAGEFHLWYVIVRTGAGAGGTTQ